MFHCVCQVCLFGGVTLSAAQQHRGASVSASNPGLLKCLTGLVTLLDKYILLHFRDRFTSVFWLQALITKSSSRAEMLVLMGVNLLKRTSHVMHQQFNIQRL